MSCASSHQFFLFTSFLFSRYKCRVIQWIGKQNFQLSQNVLDTLYGQTLVWGGMFYAPLLPLLNLIFIFITFYVKKFSLYHLCNISQKFFRESTLRIMFHFVLLLGLLTVFLPLSYLWTRYVRSIHTADQRGLVKIQILKGNLG
ncbi:hypothetical protein GDO81_023429 [Engystomops pustulosus]|uniref:Transmembrane channel-like protein n=1 Tax=Engystomops pustulosus TaxID=76066 RepID=A0AAV6YW72_ENGPU|nr:hypothetical protein GDO81_023429 [Engystomops pustulosus]